MKVLFWFRKSEAKNQIINSDPVGSIQCRIIIETEDLEIGSTKISCPKSQWDSINQILVGNSQRIGKANKRLAEVSTGLLRLFDILNTKYDHVSPQIVKEYYLSKRKFTYSIKEISTAFLEHRQKQATQKAITFSTYNVNKNYSRHILDFASKIAVVKPVQIPNNFFSELFEFMIDDNRSGERFARKVSCFAKQMLSWAKRKGMCPNLGCLQEIMPGKAESEDYIDTTHLSISQLEALYTFDFQNLVETGHISVQSANTLSEERDAFVFNCFTGMHHCDYSKKEFLIEPYLGALFLRGKRQKTKKQFSIKLLEPAVEILKRYNNELRQLPVKSNQKRNDTLKQIAVYTGIPLRLTTKVARKTFCDLAINEMLMSGDDVAACLGLTSTKYLKNYGRVREKRLLKTMKSWGELKVAS
ncbi:hypothetical protein DYBT9275_05834 [Dyadobacter sp. CECT 9275]|uniref:Phage integrase SAM-like domain-containing protein n=1 Tax=Dyadobacter helix TaxID=2822344 RepID=A0A916JIJ3_9BACT|nr:hypothetical protein [Dyadobacter sp. CECT 9275]CAG5017726.1 hypothetical protein DYBT9275_05834 [Dyadobacter sp. CECT 9275]